MMAKPWNEHRETITRLYIHDGRKLEDVRNIMKAQYGFEASTRSYRQHFDTWGLFKYNCKKRDIRRRESLARLLPSPPQTPLVQGIPTLEARLDVGGPVNMPSPESTSTRSSISSISSLSSLSSMSAGHSPEQRPLPDPQQHRLMGYPRFPYFDGHLASGPTREKIGSRPKCLHSMGPPSGMYGENDLQVALRNPSIAEGMLPPAISINDPHCEPGKPPKYLHPANTYPNAASWDISRSSSEYNEDYYRFYATAARGSQEFLSSSVPRTMGHHHRASLPSVPRLANRKSLSHETRIKTDPDQLASDMCLGDLGPS